MLLHQVFAVSVTVLLFAAISLILRSRGLKIVVLSCAFVAVLVSTQLSMKVLGSPPYSYKFPGLVTVLHFLSVSLVAFAYWVKQAEPERCLPQSIGWGRYLRHVLPIALSQPVSVIFNNKAMVFVGAGLVAVIGTLSPVVTAVLSRVLGRKLSWLCWAGVVVAFGGGIVISWSEITEAGSLSDSTKGIVTAGLVFAFLSVLGRAAKIVLMDNLLTPAAYAEGSVKEEPLSGMHLYALQFPLGTILSLMYTSATEDIVAAMDQMNSGVACVVLGTCINALALNFIGLHVLKEFGASAQQIIGKLNTICIAAISVAFLGEQLPLLVLIGSGLVLAGVAVFEQGARHDAESATSVAVPQSAPDRQELLKAAREAEVEMGA